MSTSNRLSAGRYSLCVKEPFACSVTTVALPFAAALTLLNCELAATVMVQTITSSANTPSSCFSLIVALLTIGTSPASRAISCAFAPNRLEEISPGPAAPTTTQAGELHLGTSATHFKCHSLQNSWSVPREVQTIMPCLPSARNRLDSRVINLLDYLALDRFP